MAVYEITENRLDKIPETDFNSEEFGEQKVSRRRVILLAIDKDANLLVIELKRTEDGGHMELQTTRVEIYGRFLSKRGKK